jgi:hypothetical protein
MGMQKAYFRRLYENILEYEGQNLLEDVIEAWDYKGAMEDMEKYQERNQLGNPYEVLDEELWQWYALSRINDLLLLIFQNPQKRPLLYTPKLSPDEYEILFLPMVDFTVFSGPAPFHPCLHEIVVATPSEAISQITVTRTIWPGAMYGNLVFSRAGVEIIYPLGTIIPEMAMFSTLYSTYWRHNRKTSDPSHGWGSNSQWRTDFRRDYIDADGYHYNVDGKYYLDENYTGHTSKDLRELNLEQRIELLKNRCLISSIPSDEDFFFPFWDRYQEK